MLHVVEEGPPAPLSTYADNSSVCLFLFNCPADLWSQMLLLRSRNRHPRRKRLDILHYATSPPYPPNPSISVRPPSRRCCLYLDATNCLHPTMRARLPRTLERLYNESKDKHRTSKGDFVYGATWTLSRHAREQRGHWRELRPFSCFVCLCVSRACLGMVGHGIAQQKFLDL